MKFLAIDLETTGLDPDNCNVIEIGMIVDDYTKPNNYVDCPKFHCLVRRQFYTGEPYALGMHKELFDKISRKLKTDYQILDFQDVHVKLFQFLAKNFDLDAKINLAGKNIAGFDIPFLRTLPNIFVGSRFCSFKYRHRTLDPAILYVQPGDAELPDLQTCWNRSKQPPMAVRHTALDDAWMVCQLLREKLG